MIKSTLLLFPALLWNQVISFSSLSNEKSKAFIGANHGGNDIDVSLLGTIAFRERFSTAMASTAERPYPPECELNLATSVLPDSELRAERKEHEALVKKRFNFAVRERLGELRESIANMKENLEFSIAAKCKERVSSLTEAIRLAESRDPEIVYAKKLIEKKETSDVALQRKLEAEAYQVREFIDHFNLHGLWVANFAGSGYQMINVTYHGDTLIATKVAGNSTVAIGDTLLKVDLSPVTPAGTAKSIEEITISSEMADKFNSGTKLNRYPGKCFILDKDSMTHGNFVSVGRFLSFGWEPTSSKNHVFFGRPDLELAVHLLSKCNSKYTSISDQNHISRCFDIDAPSQAMDKDEGFV